MERYSVSQVRRRAAATVCTCAVPLLLMALALLCAPAGEARADVTSLTEWTEGRLLPALVEDFTRHPRFRGRSVEVVAMRGEQAPAVVDGLSAYLAGYLAAELAAVPGTRLVAGNERDCMARAAVALRVAVEVRPQHDARAAVRVRVFDLHERTWVGGAGADWSGILNARERGLLAAVEVVEGARGRRDLPFEAGQSDLLAAVLAARLECALLDARVSSSVVDNRRVFLAPAQDLSPALQNVGVIVLHELSLAHGLRRVHRLADADLVLRPQAHRVDGSLGLYWLTLERLTEGVRKVSTRDVESVSGSVIARARAYVAGGMLPLSPGPSGGPARGQFVAPASDADSPSAEAPPGGRPSSGHGEREGGAGALPSRERNRLLTTPELVAAEAGEGCPSTSARRMVGGSAAASPLRRYRTREPSCAAVEFRVERDAEVFLIWQPATCRLSVAPGEAAPPRLQWRRVEGPVTVRAPFPSRAADAAGFASVYVIAVDAAVDPLPLRTLLEHHPGDMDCGDPQWAADLERWAEALSTSLHVLADRADWQALRVPASVLADGGGA